VTSMPRAPSSSCTSRKLRRLPIGVFGESFRDRQRSEYVTG
jgi:hypothetical protein